MPRKHPENWRVVEQIVERLERLFANSDTVVKSPDMLLDYTTGTEREVDISVTYSSGRHSAKVFFEVRDRKQLGGVEWVEQVYAKSQAVRAKAFMVHTRGFTKPAKNKANQYGIDLLTLQQMQDIDWKHWYPTEVIRSEQHLFSPLYARFLTQDDKHILDLTLPFSEPDIKLLDAKDPAKHYSARELLLRNWFAIALHDQMAVTLLQLFTLMKGKPIDFVELPMSVTLTHIIVASDPEPHPLESIELVLMKGYFPEKRVSLQPSFYRYQQVGDHQPIAELATSSFEMDGDIFQLDQIIDEEGNNRVVLKKLSKDVET